MYKKFKQNGNRIWIDKLDELLNFYNNKIHRTIGVSPLKASENPELISEKINENNLENDNIKKIKNLILEIELEFINGKINLKKV